MYGIIEQHDISVRSWARALDVFEEVELRLVSPGPIEVDPLAGRGSLRHLFCGERGERFPFVSGVAFLFSHYNLEKLYPWAVKEPR